MSKISTSYVNLGYWCLLYIPLVAAGFSLTYFAVILTPKPVLVHAHFSLMVMWLSTLIAQPLLIKNRRYITHRLLGKLSYVLIPLVLISSFLMLKIGYQKFTHDLTLQEVNGVPLHSQSYILHEGSLYALLGFIYIIWLAVFYASAVYSRRNSYVHSRYMVAAALTLIGPTVDRIFFSVLEIMRIGVFPAEMVSFLLIDSILLGLLYRDYRAGQSLKPNAIVLGVYMALQALYFLLPHVTVWDYITAALLS